MGNSSADNSRPLRYTRVPAGLVGDGVAGLLQALAEDRVGDRIQQRLQDGEGVSGLVRLGGEWLVVHR
jgi:hypothetical protein